MVEDYDWAMATLAKNFKEVRGVIIKKDKDYAPSASEMRAIDYLFWEYDYTFSND